MSEKKAPPKTLKEVSERYNVTIEALKEANPALRDVGDDEKFPKGSKLKLPKKKKKGRRVFSAFGEAAKPTRARNIRSTEVLALNGCDGKGACSRGASTTYRTASDEDKVEMMEEAMKKDDLVVKEESDALMEKRRKRKRTTRTHHLFNDPTYKASYEKMSPKEKLRLMEQFRNFDELDLELDKDFDELISRKLRNKATVEITKEPGWESKKATAQLKAIEEAQGKDDAQEEEEQLLEGDLARRLRRRRNRYAELIDASIYKGMEEDEKKRAIDSAVEEQELEDEDAAEINVYTTRRNKRRVGRVQRYQEVPAFEAEFSKLSEEEQAKLIVKAQAQDDAEGLNETGIDNILARRGKRVMTRAARLREDPKFLAMNEDEKLKAMMEAEDEDARDLEKEKELELAVYRQRRKRVSRSANLAEDPIYQKLKPADQAAAMHQTELEDIADVQDDAVLEIFAVRNRVVRKTRVADLREDPAFQRAFQKLSKEEQIKTLDQCQQQDLVEIQRDLIMDQLLVKKKRRILRTTTMRGDPGFAELTPEQKLEYLKEAEEEDTADLEKEAQLQNRVLTMRKNRVTRVAQLKQSRLWRHLSPEEQEAALNSAREEGETTKQDDAVLEVYAVRSKKRHTTRVAMLQTDPVYTTLYEKLPASEKYKVLDDAYSKDAADAETEEFMDELLTRKKRRVTNLAALLESPRYKSMNDEEKLHALEEARTLDQYTQEEEAKMTRDLLEKRKTRRTRMAQLAEDPLYKQMNNDDKSRLMEVARHLDYDEAKDAAVLKLYETRDRRRHVTRVSQLTEDPKFSKIYDKMSSAEQAVWLEEAAQQDLEQATNDAAADEIVSRKKRRVSRKALLLQDPLYQTMSEPEKLKAWEEAAAHDTYTTKQDIQTEEQAIARRKRRATRVAQLLESPVYARMPLQQQKEALKEAEIADENARHDDAVLDQYSTRNRTKYVSRVSCLLQNPVYRSAFGKMSEQERLEALEDSHMGDAAEDHEYGKMDEVLSRRKRRVLRVSALMDDPAYKKMNAKEKAAALEEARKADDADEAELKVIQDSLMRRRRERPSRVETLKSSEVYNRMTPEEQKLAFEQACFQDELAAQEDAIFESYYAAAEKKRRSRYTQLMEDPVYRAAYDKMSDEEKIAAVESAIMLQEEDERQDIAILELETARCKKKQTRVSLLKEDPTYRALSAEAKIKAFDQAQAEDDAEAKEAAEREAEHLTKLKNRTSRIDQLKANPIFSQLSQEDKFRVMKQAEKEDNEDAKRTADAEKQVALDRARRKRPTQLATLREDPRYASVFDQMSPEEQLALLERAYKEDEERAHHNTAEEASKAKRKKRVVRSATVLEDPRYKNMSTEEKLAALAEARVADEEALAADEEAEALRLERTRDIGPSALEEVARKMNHEDRASAEAELEESMEQAKKTQVEKQRESAERTKQLKRRRSRVAKLDEDPRYAGLSADEKLRAIMSEQEEAAEADRLTEEARLTAELAAAAEATGVEIPASFSRKKVHRTAMLDEDPSFRSLPAAQQYDALTRAIAEDEADRDEERKKTGKKSRPSRVAMLKEDPEFQRLPPEEKMRLLEESLAKDISDRSGEEAAQAEEDALKLARKRKKLRIGKRLDDPDLKDKSVADQIQALEDAINEDEADALDPKASPSLTRGRKTLKTRALLKDEAYQNMSPDEKLRALQAAAAADNETGEADLDLAAYRDARRRRRCRIPYTWEALENPLYHTLSPQEKIKFLDAAAADDELEDRRAHMRDCLWRHQKTRRLLKSFEARHTPHYEKLTPEEKISAILAVEADCGEADRHDEELGALFPPRRQRVNILGAADGTEIPGRTTTLQKYDTKYATATPERQAQELEEARTMDEAEALVDLYQAEFGATADPDVVFAAMQETGSAHMIFSSLLRDSSYLNSSTEHKLTGLQSVVKGEFKRIKQVQQKGPNLPGTRGLPAVAELLDKPGRGFSNDEKLLMFEGAMATDGVHERIETAGRKLDIWVMGAKGLRDADAATGTSDPYARILIPTKEHNPTDCSQQKMVEVFRTPVQQGALNPTWTQAQGKVKGTALGPTVTGAVEIEIWDADEGGNADDPLGYVPLDVNRLHAKDDFVMGRQTYQLKRRLRNRDADDKNGETLGTIELVVQWAEEDELSKFETQYTTTREDADFQLLPTPEAQVRALEAVIAQTEGQKKLDCCRSCGCDKGIESRREMEHVRGARVKGPNFSFQDDYRTHFAGRHLELLLAHDANREFRTDAAGVAERIRTRANELQQLSPQEQNAIHQRTAAVENGNLPRCTDDPEYFQLLMEWQNEFQRQGNTVDTGKLKQLNEQLAARGDVISKMSETERSKLRLMNRWQHTEQEKQQKKAFDDQTSSSGSSFCPYDDLVLRELVMEGMKLKGKDPERVSDVDQKIAEHLAEMQSLDAQEQARRHKLSARLVEAEIEEKNCQTSPSFVDRDPLCYLLLNDVSNLLHSDRADELPKAVQEYDERCELLSGMSALERIRFVDQTRAQPSDKLNTGQSRKTKQLRIFKKDPTKAPNLGDGAPEDMSLENIDMSITFNNTTRANGLPVSRRKKMLNITKKRDGVIATDPFVLKDDYPYRAAAADFERLIAHDPTAYMPERNRLLVRIQERATELGQMSDADKMVIHRRAADISDDDAFRFSDDHEYGETLAKLNVLQRGAPPIDAAEEQLLQDMLDARAKKINLLDQAERRRLHLRRKTNGLPTIMERVSALRKKRSWQPFQLDDDNIYRAHVEELGFCQGKDPIKYKARMAELRELMRDRAGQLENWSQEERVRLHEMECAMDDDQAPDRKKYLDRDPLCIMLMNDMGDILNGRPDLKPREMMETMDALDDRVDVLESMSAQEQEIEVDRTRQIPPDVLALSTPVRRGKALKSKRATEARRPAKPLKGFTSAVRRESNIGGDGGEAAADGENVKTIAPPVVRKAKPLRGFDRKE